VEFSLTGKLEGALDLLTASAAVMTAVALSGAVESGLEPRLRPRTVAARERGADGPIQRWRYGQMNLHGF
jgi:hypothetical protein